MDIVFDILLILHLVALGVGATTAIGMPIVMARMGGATPEGKQILGGIARRFGTCSAWRQAWIRWWWASRRFWAR